jgi:hypothetical protein
LVTDCPWGILLSGQFGFDRNSAEQIPGSAVPLLTTLALHGGARSIANLDSVSGTDRHAVSISRRSRASASAIRSSQAWQHHPGRTRMPSGKSTISGAAAGMTAAAIDAGYCRHMGELEAVA